MVASRRYRFELGGFNKGEFVGGYDIVRGMLEAGELTAMFDETGVAYDRTKLTA
jgi:hypothetical protein